MSPPPTFSQLQAPAHWQAMDLISDLHLQASEPATFAAWRDWMARTDANAVLILGDLFEIWVGDDLLAHDRFVQDCAQVLQRTAKRCHVGFMPGNRDFLVGDAFLQHCGVHRLEDPTVLVLGEQRFLLSHGDALCLEDTDYQAFRREVRSPAWQQAFLARPLSHRLELARQLRSESRVRQQSRLQHADADAALCLQWLQSSCSGLLIHGHTHQPAEHSLGPRQTRQVLSDWCLDHAPWRAQVLRVLHDRCERHEVLSPQLT
jgi:UDP-2,3-diacylglucosamine hydrolase